jgi:hypothetical protein
VVVEADLELLSPDRLFVDQEIAAPDHEYVPDRLERGADVLHVRVRAEIPRPVAPDLPRDEDARVRLAGDDDVGVTLVVLEADVVARPEFLDQVRFEYQRFDFGIGNDDLDVRSLREHLLDAGAERA